MSKLMSSLARKVRSFYTSLNGKWPRTRPLLLSRWKRERKKGFRQRFELFVRSKIWRSKMKARLEQFDWLAIKLKAPSIWILVRCSYTLLKLRSEHKAETVWLKLINLSKHTCLIDYLIFQPYANYRRLDDKKSLCLTGFIQIKRDTCSCDLDPFFHIC